MVTGITINPPSPVVGQKTEITIYVSNLGGTTAGRFKVYYTSSIDTPEGGEGRFMVARIPSLEPGRTTQFTFSETYLFPSRPGSTSNKVGGLVDPDNEVAEINEKNNEFDYPINVR